MEKKTSKYEPLEIEIIELPKEDIIVTSGGAFDGEAVPFSDYKWE